MTELWMNIIVGIVVRQLDRTEFDLREQDQSSSRKQWWCSYKQRGYCDGNKCKHPMIWNCFELFHEMINS